MSRHEFSRTDSSTGTLYEATVGWDRPLQTYFAQVWEFPQHKSTANDPVLWIGLQHGEISDPIVVVEAIRPFVTVTDDLEETLLSDRLATARLTDGPAQQALRKLFLS